MVVPIAGYIHQVGGRNRNPDWGWALVMLDFVTAESLILKSVLFANFPF